MKISTTQENLSRGLAIVSRISSKTVNLPILQNVLIKADEKLLRLFSTNLEIAVSSIVRARVDENGEFTIPAKLFTDYISLLPNDKIDLELSENVLIVKTGKSETKIQGIPASEFPVIPKVSEGKEYFVQAKDFQNAISKVLFAVAQNEARPELTGVLFSFNSANGGKKNLILAATDSYRLGESKINLEQKSSEETVSLIIPSRTLSEVSRVLGVEVDSVEPINEIRILVAENQIQFEIGNTELQSRIIEGNYPDYQQIIPNQFNSEVVLSRNEFINTVKAASLFTKTGLYDIRLEITPNKPVIIKSADVQTGEHFTEIHGDVKGQENYVVLNYKYLLDGLNATEDDEIVFKIIDASSPCLLVPKGSDEKYRYLVMPIRQ